MNRCWLFHRWGPWKVVSVTVQDERWPDPPPWHSTLTWTEHQWCRQCDRCGATQDREVSA